MLLKYQKKGKRCYRKKILRNNCKKFGEGHKFTDLRSTANTKQDKNKQNAKPTQIKLLETKG